ncbi:DUF5076 domain-containing protein [Pseudaminobacter sp. 19-2017]|uniref:DUF5076 domain-containing protein n=1 Tax=Pseudaminobacter soli (ex Zhang et al. 2022) TaxID=2831468 RepID=A0A942IB80_9HYPH|nr:DUF5076 domain-containing protein [Pseudaminobacter soli]MBS3651321.1 DUF5076 domain-containing protein [Pseudaminobacter soli]
MALFGRKASPAAPSSERAPFIQCFRTEDDGLVVRIDPAQVELPAHAGIMVVDIARHLARAMAQYGSACSEHEAMSEIVRLMRAELDDPTDLGSGSIVN